VSDATQLYFALVLGLSATAAILAALGPILSGPTPSSRTTNLSRVVWVILVGAWLFVSAQASLDHAARPWFGVVGFALATGWVLWTPVARAVPLGGLLLLSALRLGGAVRYGAAQIGWLPRNYATVSVSLAVLTSMGAITLMVRSTPAARKLWAALTLVSMVGELVMQWQSVRPMPAFESLYAAFFLPLLAVAAISVGRKAE
jgi:hypothetical protein